VLDGEEAEQERIDQQGRDGESSGARIDGFGNKVVADESDGVEKCRKEQKIGENA